MYDSIVSFEFRKNSRSVQGYRGAAVGKGRQLAKTELEKLKFSEMTMKEAVTEAARMYVHPLRLSSLTKLMDL